MLFDISAFCLFCLVSSVRRRPLTWDKHFYQWFVKALSKMNRRKGTDGWFLASLCSTPNTKTVDVMKFWKLNLIKKLKQRWTWKMLHKCSLWKNVRIQDITWVINMNYTCTFPGNLRNFSRINQSRRKHWNTVGGASRKKGPVSLYGWRRGERGYGWQNIKQNVCFCVKFDNVPLGFPGALGLGWEQSAQQGFKKQLFKSLS